MDDTHLVAVILGCVSSVSTLAGVSWRAWLRYKIRVLELTNQRRVDEHLLDLALTTVDLSAHHSEAHLQAILNAGRRELTSGSPPT